MSEDVSWVAAAGFGLSIVSLGWQAVVTWVRLPRLEVGLESRADRKSDADDGTPQLATTFVLTVHNRGAEAAEIYDLGLESESGVRFSHREGPRGYQRTDGTLTVMSSYVRGPSMPALLEARSTLSWTILDGATAEHGPSVRWRGWAERYRASGKNRHVFSKTTFLRAKP